MHTLILYHVFRESINRLFSIARQERPLNMPPLIKPEIFWHPQSIEILGAERTENRIVYEIPAQSTVAIFFTLEFIRSSSAVRLFVARKVIRKRTYDMPKNSNVLNSHIFNRRTIGVAHFCALKWHKFSNQKALRKIKRQKQDFWHSSRLNSTPFHASPYFRA